MAQKTPAQLAHEVLAARDKVVRLGRDYLALAREGLKEKNRTVYLNFRFAHETQVLYKNAKPPSLDELAEMKDMVNFYGNLVFAYYATNTGPRKKPSRGTRLDVEVRLTISDLGTVVTEPQIYAKYECDRANGDVIEFSGGSDYDTHPLRDAEIIMITVLKLIKRRSTLFPDYLDEADNYVDRVKNRICSNGVLNGLCDYIAASQEPVVKLKSKWKMSETFAPIFAAHKLRLSSTRHGDDFESEEAKAIIAFNAGFDDYNPFSSSFYNNGKFSLRPALFYSKYADMDTRAVYERIVALETQGKTGIMYGEKEKNYLLKLTSQEISCRYSSILWAIRNKSITNAIKNQKKSLNIKETSYMLFNRWDESVCRHFNELNLLEDFRDIHADDQRSISATPYVPGPNDKWRLHMSALHLYRLFMEFYHIERFTGRRARAHRLELNDDHHDDLALNMVYRAFKNHGIDIGVEALVNTINGVIRHTQPANLRAQHLGFLRARITNYTGRKASNQLGICFDPRQQVEELNPFDEDDHMSRPRFDS